MAILGSRDLLFVGLCFVIHFIYRSRRKTLLPYPPGPPRWPLIGNAFSIPKRAPYKYYKELAQKLGSKIIYLEALGKPIVVLNDLQTARDLLEKRSALYSSRGRMVMYSDIMQLNLFFILMPYGDEWRIHRRLFQQYFSPNNIQRERELELEVVRKGLLPNLCQYPRNVDEQIRSCIGSISIIMTYGLRIRRTGDPMVELVESSLKESAFLAAPGMFLVETIPALKYMPEWMPGANFKTLARKGKTRLIEAAVEPYRETLKHIENGTVRECFVSSSLEQHKDKPDYEIQADHIMRAASQIYGASQTTVATLRTFVLAMLKYPDIQRQAQQEIDSVVGNDRLPDFSDKPHLPYLSAILKEVLRWNPPLPMGFPHMTSDEDSYQGYYIPKGSVVIANTYAMLHDENVFPDPLEFKPERYLKNGKIYTDDILDPELYASFGFGRRICPGSHIGLSTLYLSAASLLAVFDILPELDAEGNPVEVVPDFVHDEVISEPKKFKCNVALRKGKDVEALLSDYLGCEYL